MEAILTTFLSDPRLHVLAVVLLALVFKNRVKRFFCADIIIDLDNVKRVQEERKENYRKIADLEIALNYTKGELSALKDEHRELDRKMDDMNTLLVALNTKMDLLMESKNKGE